MQSKNFLNKKIKVTQIKGGSKLNPRQKSNLIGLGLRGIGSSSSLKATLPIIGMIDKVNHVIEVSVE